MSPATHPAELWRAASAPSATLRAAAPLLALLALVVLVLAQPGAVRAVGLSDAQTYAADVKTFLDNSVAQILHQATLQQVFDNATYASSTQRNGTKIVNALADEIYALVERNLATVKQIAANAETLYDQAQTGTEYETCTYYDTSSASNLAPLEYSSRFKQAVSTANTAVKLPSTTSVSSSVLKTICWGKSLLPTFQANLAADPSMKWQYFGAATGGVYTIFPAMQWQKDSSNNYLSYDPRYRPWYVGGSSGPKNVVIIIDVSGSMSLNNRLTIAKGAATTVLGTLSENDYVTVIPFSSTASYYSSCFPNRLVRASSENVAQFTTYVNSFSAYGGTNFAAAFTQAFAMLAATTSAEGGSGCEKVVLFLTDGEPTEGSAQTQSSILALISSLNTADVGARIFTFALGSGASQSIPRAIALANRGLFKSVPDNGDLISQMGSYYQYFALGLVGNPVYWTGPYFDALGLGMMVTVAVPAYDRKGSIPVFLGVAGVDIPLADLLLTATQDNTQLSYSFIVNNEGQTILHPGLLEPQQYLSAPVAIDISSLESGAPATQFAAVRTGMIHKTNGSAAMLVQRPLPNGDVLEGVHFESVQSTYYWRGTNGSVPFAVCYVVASSETTERKLQLPSSFITNYYHQLALIPSEYSGPVNAALQPASDALRPNLLVSFNQSTYKVAPRGFLSPSEYLQTVETSTTVGNIHKVTNGLSGGFNVFDSDVRPVTLVSSEIQPYWIQSLTNSSVWVYFGSVSGVWRLYPGHNASTSYDPTVRPWFLRALAFTGQNAVSTPYLDASGAGKVVTISHTVYEGISSGTHSTTDRVEGVSGIDYLYSTFHDTVRPYNCSDSCTSGSDCVRCWLVDSSGLLLTDPSFKAAADASTSSYTEVFLGALYPEIAYVLKSGAHLQYATYIDYKSNKDCTYWTMNSSVISTGASASISVGCLSGSLYLAPIGASSSGASLYMLVVGSYSRTSSCTTSSSITATVPAPVCTARTVNACTATQLSRAPLSCPAFSMSAELLSILQNSAASTLHTAGSVVVTALAALATVLIAILA